LYEDYLTAGETQTFASALPRAVYVTAGSATMAGREIGRDDGVVSLDTPTISAGPDGACIWRFEIANAEAAIEKLGTQSCLKMQPAIFDRDVTSSHLLRLDSVAFPAGGCAFLHTHQGPGIRCLIEGTIRIDTDGHSNAYGPGAPWYEAGPEPVFAQADNGQPSRFIRAMVLPKELAGKSSIRYVNEADQAKPKSQTYRVFDEKPLG
jgi:hypothetical protein